MKVKDKIVLEDITGEVTAVDIDTHTIRWETGDEMTYTNDVDWSKA